MASYGRLGLAPLAHCIDAGPELIEHAALENEPFSAREMQAIDGLCEQQRTGRSLAAFICTSLHVPRVQSYLSAHPSPLSWPLLRRLGSLHKLPAQLQIASTTSLHPAGAWHVIIRVWPSAAVYGCCSGLLWGGRTSRHTAQHAPRPISTSTAPVASTASRPHRAMHSAGDQASIDQLLRHVGVAWSREGLLAGEHDPGTLKSDLRIPAKGAG
ncbi:hypothetical protein M409DRAFT_50487 [Zasmidium cellare ATCC 36951]|uniref:Uncharacterized protein n=1 Tax=Zasmidium cellare ATCC 36951 TaxID=1080233 RepID=A0A6A6D077_ZASCE|nr:uncharacterized protein M409DRAFT_50487 [Zasmidium cellare ATCC 36951]KAF2171860.1 hypothetical protein M409DRAFT_50487 [Zasmidium cellare ATCC 36951]